MSDAKLTMTPRAAERLQQDHIAWLGTTRPDGRPHVAPVWFHWDGETALIFTQGNSQKVRNLRVRPGATLALDSTHGGGDVVIVEGIATLLVEPSSAVLAQAYLDKYAAPIAQMGMTPEGMAADYAQPIRIRATRIMSWSGEPAGSGESSG